MKRGIVKRIGEYWGPKDVARHIWNEWKLPKGVTLGRLEKAAEKFKGRFGRFLEWTPEEDPVLNDIVEEAWKMSTKGYQGGVFDWTPREYRKDKPQLGINLPEPKFNAGRLVMTPGADVALGELEEAGGDPSVYLERHLSGDWGEIPDEDKVKNDRMVIEKGTILSAYTLETGKKIWIITDPGHEATTFLLPGEY
jgi:hypothetical protein